MSTGSVNALEANSAGGMYANAANATINTAGTIATAVIQSAIFEINAQAEMDHLKFVADSSRTDREMREEFLTMQQEGQEIVEKGQELLQKATEKRKVAEDAVIVQKAVKKEQKINAKLSESKVTGDAIRKLFASRSQPFYGKPAG